MLGAGSLDGLGMLVWLAETGLGGGGDKFSSSERGSLAGDDSSEGGGVKGEAS